VAVPPSHNDEVFSLGSDMKYGVSEDSDRRSSNKAVINGFTHGEKVVSTRSMTDDYAAAQYLS
jgi:hypothetical protein